VVGILGAPAGSRGAGPLRLWPRLWSRSGVAFLPLLAAQILHVQLVRGLEARQLMRFSWQGVRPEIAMLHNSLSL
jgi:hypothetical protein